MTTLTRLLPLLFLLAVLLSACTHTGDARRAGGGPGDGRQAAALHDELDALLRRHEQASARLAAGDRDAQLEREAVLESLRQQTERCLATAPCDASRYIAAYDALVRGSVPRPPLSDDPDPELQQPEDDAVSPLLGDLPQAQRTITLLRGRDLADVITLNEPVKAALNEWLTWLRPNLMEAWENYQYMRYMMWPHYEQAGLPEALLFAIMARESQGKVHAVSRAGAAGPLQFMPATGQRFGLGRRPDDGFDTRFDPRESTRAQVEYLNEQFDRLNENLELVIAAYNGGEGRLRRLSNGGERSLWDPEVFNALPQETQIYVPMVLAAAYLFLHPERFGLEFPRFDTRPAVLTLAQPASINELAICLGQAGGVRNGWFRALRNLNPKWDNKRVLEAGTQLEVPAVILPAYQDHCRDGERVSLAAELNRARMPVTTPSPAREVMAGRAPGSGGTHVVRRGETLYAIASRHGCTMRKLAHNNRIAGSRYLLRPGQRLNLANCR